MLGSLAKKFFGSANERFVTSLRPLVDKINALENAYQLLSDEQLKAKTAEFRSRLETGAPLDSLLPEAFATVREASRRVLNMRHFDVQLIGGIVLHKGMISEMKTGEGKTLVATCPVYLNALGGKGVHVVTVNDYLAQRDSAWMGKIYNFLGLSVGVIVNGVSDSARKVAYAADITYGTNNEFGFDYLRDNMKYDVEQMVQRPFNFAIVDEVDSILVDEARTPLIISGPTEDNSELYAKIDRLMPKLDTTDTEKDEKAKTVVLTDDGVRHVEELLREEGLLEAGTSLYDITSVSLVHHVNQALRAHGMFTRDVDYIVKENKVIIIDEFTGRMMEGRRYSEGLHQALEAKEKVKINNENQTLASITFQNYFRLYPKLAGMTGTAMTEATEFMDIYKLQVIDIPTNVPVSRIDDHDYIYRTAAEKYRAVVIQIAECMQREQPVLVGTVSIEKSEYLSKLLKSGKFIKETGEMLLAKAAKLKQDHNPLKGDALNAFEYNTEIGNFLLSICNRENKGAGPIPHQVLNARYHEQEASIIAQAGRRAAVTIATNMAGRGTDIMLGGNPDLRIAQETAAITEENEKSALTQKIRAEIEADKTLVKEAGGLFVIGTERHESRRIDNQLRGRSGRQGDPGASKFFISLEDDLMRIFGSERIDGMLQKMGLKEGEAIFHSWMNAAIEKAQQKVEGRNYDIRKNLLKFDNVMNDQRKAIFEQRLELIQSDDVSSAIVDMRNQINSELIGTFIPKKSYAEEWNAEGLQKDIFRIYGLHLPVLDWVKEEGIADEEVLERLSKVTEEQIAHKEQHYGTELMRMAEKRVILQTLDGLWKDHLLSLDHLRQGINLRAYGQRDPLNEYKQEAFNLFEGMLSQLRETVTSRMAHLQIHVDNPEALSRMEQTPRRMVESRFDPALAGEGMNPHAGGMYPLENSGRSREPVRTHVKAENRDPGNPETWGKVGRNDPCPCGSGKKFKQCHGALLG
jgi:preprotein translocase subunit SecA